MFARVTFTQIKPDRFDEANQIFTDSVVPVAQTQKGFKSIYLLTDQATGKGITLTFWESEADALAGEKSGYYQEQISKFKDLLAAPPVREGYEVTGQG